MSAQHTPGPWQFIQEDGTAASLVESDGASILIMYALENSTGAAHFAANIQLICTAPELLMLASLYALDFTDEKQARAEFGDAAVDRELQRRAIVAKATHQ